MKTVKIDVTLLIVLLTGLAYGTAYIYEYSFQAFYQLPTVFIDLNINTITGSLFYLILAVTGILIISSFFTTLIMKLKGPFFVNIPLWVLIYFSLMVIVAAVIMGYGLAKDKEEYMVLKQKEELFVVIKSYKDNLVIAPLDIEKETIKPKFQTIDMKDAKDTEVINFENGIKVDKLKSSKELKKEIK
ncbi:hypothetical protein ACQJ0K_28545 [Priestia megaterium]|uniref:hypothetical protein n=1 Tax=Priestia megaterium TaxID=1404 RepID=UPI003CF75670